MGDREVDQELVLRAQRGDKRAFELLVAKYQRKLGRLLSRMVRDPAEVEDVPQEAFIKAYRALGNFRGDSAFYTWLYRIAVNIAIDSQRRQKRNPLDFRETMDGLFEKQNEVAKDPFSDVHDRELREKLVSAINDLTPEHKAVIILRTVEGLSYKDIGEILGCSEGTVMSRLHYARKKLQQKLSAFL